MKQIARLMATGIIAGVILALSLKIIQITTGNPAYILLFNMDYIPALKQWDNVPGAGMLFHFITCVVSVIALFYILKILKWERIASLYVAVYTIGGGILFFLSALTETPPAYTNIAAWLYWTIGHAIFGVVVGLLIKSRFLK
ncbi:hypothetical protein [Virgibacillus sp. SK37]|uniref:hypothetical protein n=1 Tax=Virgibacillus sp. SK37 TaxID=403957 RepID=UPI0004D0E4F1|nr:hypothetical protein [Virgibacillus sp. SK37]AIF43080.1 hypothetical protein X953_07875 [Virgibacillus sp. SK37]